VPEKVKMCRHEMKIRKADMNIRKARWLALTYTMGALIVGAGGVFLALIRPDILGMVGGVFVCFLIVRTVYLMFYREILNRLNKEYK
jgi:uncharacterized membrane protein YfcA